MSRELRTAKMKNSSGGIKKSFTNKKFKSGAYSSFITILVIAIVVVVNLVFGKLDLSSDLSSNSLFTLSKDTKKALKSAKNSVTLYYLVTDGKETEYIEKVLDQYPKASSKVKLKKIDPVVNPGFASKYLSESEAGSVAQNDVIVVNDSTKNSSYVQNTDMYYSNTDYSSYTQSSGEYYLDVEGKITSAIQKVLAEKKTKMYILKGHDEQEVGTTMSTSFSKMNIDTDELTLYSEDKVPSDCDILLINGATKDISKEEKNKILAYMKKGGNAVINLQYGTKDTPNLRALLKYYGLNEQIGSVCETQGNYYNYVNSVIPTLDSSNEIASGVSGVVVMPSPVGISKFKGARKSLTISEFMTTSKGSYLKLDTSSGKAAKEKGDIDGPFAMGVSVTDKIDDNKSAKLVVYASAYAFSDDVISTNQLDNGSLFTNAVKLLSNSDVEETSINAKSLSYTYVSLTQGTQFFWATVIIIIIPVGLLITGFAIWFSRRRK